VFDLESGSLWSIVSLPLKIKPLSILLTKRNVLDKEERRPCFGIFSLAKGILDEEALRGEGTYFLLVQSVSNLLVVFKLLFSARIFGRFLGF
jgi:hypothetical protein